MKIFFPDGTETVTGSKWSLESGDSQILLDCGLFQDYKWLCERSRQPLLPDIASKLLAICFLAKALCTGRHFFQSLSFPVIVLATMPLAAQATATVKCFILRTRNNKQQ